MPRRSSHRIHPSQWAFRLHRLSGLGLACYLPAHFYLLADQIGRGAQDLATPWFSSQLSQLSHAALAGLLGAHLVGGIRVLVIQHLRLSRGQGLWLAATVSAAFAVALMFALGLYP